MSEEKYNPDLIEEINEIKKEKPISVTEYENLFNDLTIESNGKGPYYLKLGDKILYRSFRKTKIEALIYAINEGIVNIDEVKHHIYLESEIKEIEERIKEDREYEEMIQNE